MNDPGYVLGVYLHLARASARRHRPHVRDRLLVLGAAIASEIGLDRIAARCRAEVLQQNPHHLISHWPTIKQALGEDEFLCFLRQLQRRFPLEKAERMLQSLGVELGRERQAYYSDYEYAAALLGTTPEALDQQTF